MSRDDHAPEKQHDSGPLSHQRKRQIEAEEIYREEVRAQLEATKPRTLWGKMKLFCNSSFGIWMLSTVVVGVFTWAYTELSTSRETQQRNKKRIEMLDTEIAGRLHNINDMIRADVDPLLYLFVMMGGSTLGSSSDTQGAESSQKTKSQPPGVFPDFKDRPLTSLIWELKGLVPENERPELEVTQTRAQELNTINVKLIQEFYTKVQNEGAEDLFAPNKKGTSETVEEIKDTVTFLLGVHRWEKQSVVSSAARALVEKNQRDRQTKKAKRLEEHRLAIEAAEREQRQAEEEARKKEEAADKIKLGFISATAVGFETKGSITLLIVEMQNISGRDIKAFRGKLTSIDSFGNNILSQNIQQDSLIKSKESYQEKVELSPNGRSSERSLTKKKPAEILLEFKTYEIINADGSRQVME